jgi:2-polyprenyl-6-methoxyphenol hydroxylase-like FAD-dependent oxidoreductase
MPDSAPLRDAVGIVGGGVAGLALASALADRRRVTLFEARSEVRCREEGVFLTLAPNGVNALRALGLAEQVCAAGVVTTGMILRNETGRIVASFDYGDQRARFGAPTVSIPRGRLTGLLIDAARRGGAELVFGARVRDLREKACSVEVELDGGRTRAFGWLAGCDGVGSIARSRVAGRRLQLRFTGQVGTGGFAPVGPAPEAPPGVMQMVFGRRAFFGFLPAQSGLTYWFDSFAAETAVSVPSDPEGLASRVQSLHDDAPSPARRIVEAIGCVEGPYPIFEAPALDAWSRGRTVLLGDAAHAIAPHAGQGASLALEDAVVLARCLSEAPADEALSLFERLRRPRADAALRLGRFSGGSKRAPGPLARRARDLLLPWLVRIAGRRQARFFGYRADVAPLKPVEP